MPCRWPAMQRQTMRTRESWAQLQDLDLQGAWVAGSFCGAIPVGGVRGPLPSPRRTNLGHTGLRNEGSRLSGVTLLSSLKVCSFLWTCSDYSLARFLGRVPQVMLGRLSSYRTYGPSKYRGDQHSACVPCVGEIGLDWRWPPRGSAGICPRRRRHAPHAGPCGLISRRHRLVHCN